MSSHSYEIALYGEFLKGDLKPVLNRIALHSESSHQMHSREVIFDPPDATQQRDANQEPALLRAKKELLELDAKW
jgi:mediator of RNA polymerase II transcription subunit 18